MSLLSSLFSGAKKANLSPNIVPGMPQQINPQAYGDLSQLAHNFTNGVGTGYGDQFVNQASNPIAASMRRNFQNITSPQISNQYSARGLGRSSLAANEQGLQEGNVESNIGNMMSQLYQVNEAQKKNDQQFGAGLGQKLLTGDVNAQQNQANASERLANATAGQENAINAANQQKAQGFMSAASPIVGNFFSGPQGMGMLQSLGLGPGGKSGAQAPIGGNTNDAMIQSILASFGA